ncbi:hypothetical protein CDAR_421381 [Caerostris darwini]|uniref:Uncharacterized protein n=1 Tax=Caerostris darwini TaxID=1538125 RepID=A0AAV4SWS9_9ARAC|nr:hypothetical protein CDAR_421381 [Caerostris darwini]
MKNLSLLALLMICSMFCHLVRGQDGDCREIGKKMAEELEKMANDGELPECAEIDEFKNLIINYGEEDEQQYVEEFKAMYQASDDKDAIKECVEEVMKGALAKIEDIPEKCQEKIENYADELTA